MLFVGFIRTAFSVLIVLALLSYAPPAGADCSTNEMTAVFVVGGIFPADEQALETLSVYPVAEPTYPPEAELIAAIQNLQPCWTYYLIDTITPFRHYLCPPADFGAAALIDERTGQIPFAGTVIWAGWGEVTVPTESSHDWAYVAGEPAAEPISLEIFPSELYYYVDPDVLAASVLAELLQTDVLHSFAACGEYSAFLYAYTPAVGVLEPEAAKAVLIVSGLCGPPWNGEPVSNDRISWGAIKSCYR